MCGIQWFISVRWSGFGAAASAAGVGASLVRAAACVRCGSGGGAERLAVTLAGGSDRDPLSGLRLGDGVGIVSGAVGGLQERGCGEK